MNIHFNFKWDMINLKKIVVNKVVVLCVVHVKFF